MRKYLYIFKSEIMTNIQYIGNVLFGFIGFFVMMFIFLNLWQAIYDDPNELIAGYNMNQTIWYVAITEVLWSIISGRKYTKKIVEDVKTGNITYNLNKPYSYIGYSIFNHLAGCFIRFLVYFILGLLLVFIFLGSFPSLDIVQILLVLLTIFLATLINTLLLTFIGLFSFIVEDSNPFYWVYSKLILVLGVMFPIEFFPPIVQTFINYSPIYVVSYGPARLFVNFNYSDFISIIIAQLIYLIISFLLCLLIYKKGVKKLNVNGG
ncbi:MAG: ABC-2 family transporter protein [Bacilli bacterium]|nr:ABC-2 family transporter protein [Bacilli bacterium]